jgi:hypothetical protein
MMKWLDQLYTEYPFIYRLLVEGLLTGFFVGGATIGGALVLMGMTDYCSIAIK